MRPLQYLKLIAKYLLISIVLLYVADWSVFEIRLSRGGGLGSASVEQYLKTPLKGNKAEYDYVGTVEENCSLTMFAQYANSQWNAPCWWLRKHRVQWQ